MATKLLIGLGNPDPQYQQTRHNIGFMFLDSIARDQDIEFKLDKNTNAWLAKGKLIIGGKSTSVVLARPESYVNTTGPIVAKLKTILKLKPKDIILIQDDLDIPLGNVKISFEKNSGGHRGVESVMTALKTKKFFRLRLGIANPALKRAYDQSEKAKNELIKKFVLARFAPAELLIVKKIFNKAVELLASTGTQLVQ